MEIALGQYVSASTAGIVYVGCGFQPDAVIHVQAHGATNPNVQIWINNDRLSAWAASLSLLITGSTGVITRIYDANTPASSGIRLYAGGDQVASAETDNTAGKHVTRLGVAAAANDITPQGFTVPAALQTNSGANVWIALRGDI